MPSTPSSVDYTFCTSEESVSQAMTALGRAEYVVLDCEGQSLGRTGGILSLLTIGTAHAEQIFVFDALSLDKDLPFMEPVIELLGSDEVIKVVWDGRMDCLEILLKYGVRMGGVLDLQIAEVVSRSLSRGEGDFQRRRRLCSGLFRVRDVNSDVELYDGLNLVIGMQKCLEDTGLAKDNSKDQSVVRMHNSNSTAMWMKRPLSAQLLQYAAHDVFLIALLYEHFKAKGWLPRSRMPTLLAQSARYNSIYTTKAQTAAEDRRKAWALVPLDVLTEPSGTQYPCTVCRRMLSLHCFERSNRPFPRRRVHCRLCHVVALKRGHAVSDKWIEV